MFVAPVCSSFAGIGSFWAFIGGLAVVTGKLEVVLGRHGVETRNEKALLALLEDSIDEFARRYVERVTAEVPEYRDAPASLLEETEASARAIVVRSIAMVREGASDLGPDYRSGLHALGVLRAETGFSLHAALRGFEIGTRVLWELWIEKADQEGLLDAATLQRFFGLGLDVYATCVRDFSESYLGAQEAMHGRIFDALNAFFVRLVAGAKVGELGVAATALGLHDTDHYYVVGAPLEQDGRSLTPHDQRTIAKRLSGALGRTCLFGTLGRVGVLVVDAAAPSQDAAIALDDALAVASPDGDRLIVICSPRRGLEGLRAGLTEVTEVVSLANSLRMSGIQHAANLVVHRLLAATPAANEALSATLRGLHYERNGAELIATLRAFVEHGCSTTRTAEALFLHRNSLRYRLRRIEALIGMPIAPNRLMLELALMSGDLHG